VMGMDSLARQRLIAMVSKADEAINLAEAALLIAQEEYPDLDIAAYLASLDRMADVVDTRSWDDQKPQARIEVLNHYLFDNLGFRGNLEEYDDPRNSFLNEVLDRRTGIPITISTIYLEIGWRLGMPLQGVGFPGHFLVKYLDSGGETVIDPFGRGEVLTVEGCQRRLDHVYGGRLQFQPSFLAAATKRQILARILTNLKRTYLAASDHRRVLAAVERILVINPDLGSELRDRGILRMELNQTSQAVTDLELYVRTCPGADDVEEIRKRLRGLRQAQASLN